jgi:signal transduction histidine kinase
MSTQSNAIGDWLWPVLFVFLGWLIAAWIITPSSFRSTNQDVVEINEVLDANNTFVPVAMTKSARATIAFRVPVQTGQDNQHTFLLSFASQPTAMTINGVHLERIALHRGADDVGLRQAFLYLVPKDFPSGSSNTLTISAEPRLGRVRLGGLYSGPRSELERRFDQLRTVRVGLTDAAIVAAGMIALFSALIWNARRNETMYGWFAAGIAFWMVYLVHFAWFRAPMDSPIWQTFIHVCLGFALYCMIRFCHLFLQLPANPLEQPLLRLHTGISVVVLLIALIAPHSPWQQISMNVVLRLVLFLFGIMLMSVLVKAAIQSKSRQTYWLLAACVLGISFGLHDSVVVLAERNTATLIFHLGILPFLAIFGFSVILRFSNLLSDAQAQNAVLDSRVQEKTAALERIFSSRQELEREKLLVAERHRLATDLHDGAGSQLVSLLAAVRRDGLSQEQMEQALLEAIADLRLVMDSIDSMGSDLAEALGQFRSRLEPRIHAAGVKSKWRTANLRDGLKLSPRRTLNVFRALQEGIVNVLKHAQATEVEISARDAGSVLELCIRDNGKGLNAELFDPAVRAKRGGRGLSNFDSRMKSLGGYAKFAAASDSDLQPGLEIRLYVPIPPENETKW